MLSSDFDTRELCKLVASVSDSVEYEAYLRCVATAAACLLMYG